jgi:hypothetical protein
MEHFFRISVLVDISIAHERQTRVTATASRNGKLSLTEARRRYFLQRRESVQTSCSHTDFVNATRRATLRYSTLATTIFSNVPVVFTLNFLAISLCCFIFQPSIQWLFAFPRRYINGPCRYEHSTFARKVYYPICYSIPLTSLCLFCVRRRSRGMSLALLCGRTKMGRPAYG